MVFYRPLTVDCWQAYTIVLEEEVVPSRDFLHFMAQCLPILAKDDSLVGVSAWNENGALPFAITHHHHFMR